MIGATFEEFCQKRFSCGFLLASELSFSYLCTDCTEQPKQQHWAGSLKTAEHHSYWLILVFHGNIMKFFSLAKEALFKMAFHGRFANIWNSLIKIPEVIHLAVYKLEWNHYLG